MPTIKIPIDNGFYVSESLPLSNQMCTNWYPNTPQVQGSLSEGSLFGCSGISEIATTGVNNQINRGSHVKNGIPYFLNGENLIRLDIGIDSGGNEVFTTVAIGNIPGNQRVSMADNGKQLMILVPSGKGYIVDESSEPIFTEITDLSFEANGLPQQVVFVDSFFVCSTNSKKFIRSSANDGTTWSALDVFTAESDPDDIVGLQVHNNKLFVMGSEVTEEFNNNSGLFQRTGFFIDKGLYAPSATIATNNGFMWLGGGTNESAAIWVLQGNTPVKVSTTAIDLALQQFTLLQIRESFAYSYAKGGAYFVGFSLPTKTFEINTVTGKWHERTSSILKNDGSISTFRWRPNSVITAYNRVLCGDSQDGRIGSIESDTYTEYDENIVRIFSTQVLNDLGNSLTLSALEVTMESGAGNSDCPNPVVRVSTSSDGKTFNNELWRNIGGVGQFSQRAVFNRLGRFPRLCIIKIEMSDPVKPAFLQLTAKVKGGSRGR